jgi:hypothetical protein
LEFNELDMMSIGVKIAYRFWLLRLTWNQPFGMPPETIIWMKG